jgi:DNA polymerase elongation subunit (family B)
MKRMPVNISLTETQEFQIIDWFDCDYTTPYSKDDLKIAKLDREHNKKYTIFAFGVNRSGESICCRINDYKPYFYIRIPDNYTDEQIEDMKAAFTEDSTEEIGKIPYDEIDNDIKFTSMYYKSAVLADDIELVEREIFWKFMNKQKFKFLKISFHSKDAMRFYYQYLKNPVNLNISGDKYGNKYKYNLFEADFEPMLRFYHDRKLLPSGWVSINKFNIVTEQSKSQINISCKWDEFNPLDRDEIAPLRIAAFDIEADSSHGDFPIAKKDCKKLANQLVITWIRELTILNKENKGSDKYLSAFSNIQQEEDFFNKRIQQALFIDEYSGLDNEIDYLYLKNRYNSNYQSIIKSKLNSSKFRELCEQIYYIVKNYKIGIKIKANNDMKSVIKSIQATEEAHLEKYKKIEWDDLLRIIEQVSKRNNKVNMDLVYKKYITKDIMVKYINFLLNKFLGEVEGDRVIQIGTVFWTYGEKQCFHNNIITLQECSDFLVGEEPCDIISHSYSKKSLADRAEKRVLLEWTKLIEEYDPDIIIGYNTFGFDMAFMYDRAVDLFNYDMTQRFNPRYENEEYTKFINMGRLKPELRANCGGSEGRLINKKLSSSALGDNFLFYFNMPGRVQIDLLKVCQSSMTKLPSYKLDDVASFYISGKIVGFGKEEPDDPGKSRFIKVKNINEIDDGNFVVITMTTTGQQLYDGAKIAIKNIDREAGILELEKSVPTNCLPNYPQWGLAKDDVSPKDIFRLQGGTNDDRAIVAKYCIQDCVLLIRLLKKLEVVPNNIGMSNVSLIPFCYIFLRGQGIKIFSLIVNECASEGYLLPTLDKVETDEVEINNHNGYINKSKDTFKNKKYDEGDISKLKAGFQLSNDFNVIEMSEDSYEGAIVLKPKPDIYFEPVTVLDFSSLYPSEMIASDLSHDRIVEDACWLGDKGIIELNKLGYDVLDRSYDNYTWIDPKNKNKGKVKNGIKTVRYVQSRTGEKGLIPKVLMKLLGARKATKKRMKAEKDPFKQAILEGLQLAYKLTANSLYGQIGAKTSKIYKQEIAASTTAGGRENIYKARDFCLENNPGCDVVYGDTDSVFVKLNLDYTLQPPPEECPDIFKRFGTPYKAPDRESVFAKGGTYPETKLDKIKRSLEIGFWIQEKLKADKIFRPPHDLEYEKVYYPLILITKKRYIGIKYEFDPEEGKKTSMGVVTKRRDNAPILKHIFIGVVDTLMKECDLYKAIDFVRDACLKMINDEFDLNMFVISKTLREYYKDPEAIAHKVLAMRMGERDPGNKPASNERIPYVYIKINELPGVDYLQGDRIEHINYVREQALQVDYEVYIKNQIMKPVSQIFELVVELLPGFPYNKIGKQYYADMEYRLYDKFKGDLKKMEDKLREEKGKMVQKLIFGDLLQMADKKVNKINTVDNYFKCKNIKETQITSIDIRNSSDKPIIIKKKKKQASIASFFKAK